MMLLLLFTYCTLFLHYATSYRTTFDISRYPRDNDRILQQAFQESQNQPASGRQPRQNRFFPGNNFNQFGSGNFRPGGGFSWNDGRNINNGRPLRQTDFIFDEDNEFNDNVVLNRRPTTQRIPIANVGIPGMATTRSPCEDTCQATTQFDPVCGDNNVTYTNIYWLRCAQRCGRNVNIQYPGACPRVP